MIKHDGIVIAVYEDGTVLVRIVQTSACASCKAKAMCASAESVEKELKAMGDGQLVKGDEVEVMVQQKMGWKAVVLAYLLPFFVMLAVIMLGNEAMRMLGEKAVSETVLGTVSLCAIALYYIVLGMFKDKLQKEFSFTARKK